MKSFSLQSNKDSGNSTEDYRRLARAHGKLGRTRVKNPHDCRLLPEPDEWIPPGSDGGWDPDEIDEESTYDGTRWTREDDLSDLKNEIGIPLKDVRQVSWRLHCLLGDLNPKLRYTSISEADMNTVYLLIGWRFDPDAVAEILRTYRDRRDRTHKHPEKMQRRDKKGDYAIRTVEGRKGRRTYKDRVDPIDPPLAHALAKSAKGNEGRGPKASRHTIIKSVGGLCDAAIEGHEYPVRTTEITEYTPFTNRRTRRGLQVYADAGYVNRIEGREYRWDLAETNPCERWITVDPPESFTPAKAKAWPHCHGIV